MTDDLTAGIPLVIAAHGTRSAEGIAQCRALVDRVRRMLPGTPVELGFVELAEPGIDEAVERAIAGQSSPVDDDSPRAVVVPLMLHTGGHVRQGIPEAIDAGRHEERVVYSRPLSPDPRLRRVLVDRVTELLGSDWRARDTDAVLVGRGADVAEANAAHYTLTRMFWEESGLARVEPAFIQVTRPSVPEALSALAARGQDHILVLGNFLFTGKLDEWLHEQVDAWAAAHPGIEVRVAPVIGDCEELARVVVDRYREPLDEAGLGEGAPVYMSALRLQDRPVLVVGAGRVAERRIVRLLEAGAQVHVVAPNAGIRVSRMAAQGQVRYDKRPFAPDDLDGVWFVQALTNDPQVNAEVGRLCQERRIFCVRGDAGRLGSAFTPATGQAGGMTVSVVGDRTPRRSAKLRDELIKALQD
ncbi:CbiX/SirB N-terminal domain-containing protein [Acidipropionibacterium timonense]|uniref:CbiX/SirB N-terminal domain-containing protein n=1 Tax=Acidipropionibacterium timonense TaxID=2161818 RepID=UPI00103110E9|nr:CbiX/SirB N-terminal domain-containing protein [Acidipropionibacterium timonense]